MPAPINNQPLACLRAACVIGPGNIPASIAARHFAFAQMKLRRGQAISHTVLAKLPKHTPLRAEVPRPTARSLRLVSSSPAPHQGVAAILAARMMAGIPASDWDGAA